MFGSWDITFCAQKNCPHAQGEPGKTLCGRHINNFKGHNLLLWQSDFAPDESGHCGMYYEPKIWDVPKWMEELAENYAKEHDIEEARREELLDADSLDSDV